MDSFLISAPLPLLAALIFVGLMIAREAGGMLGRVLARNAQSDETEHGYILSGVLGLLALLIAFTFGLALDRYETRRGLVVAEANAIGTAEMRVRLLDPPHAQRLVALYRDYAETRLRYGHATRADKPPLQKASEDLRSRIEAETLVAVQPIRTAPLSGLVVTAVNESLDVGVEREAANAARVPPSIFLALVLYALISAGVLGSALNTARSPHRTMTGLMFVLLTLALCMILDLDRPQGGTIRVSQEPMEKLVAGLRATPPPSEATAPPSPATPASAAASGSSRPSAR